MENTPVLALYDVKGKQEFIFRTDKIKEIIGGSLIIRDVYRDYLAKAAKEGPFKDKNGLFGLDKQVKKLEDFSRVNWESHLAAGYIGEVVYEGGGELYVLYESEDTAKQVNQIFTKMILEEIGGLKVLCSFISDIDFDDYKADRKWLKSIHRQRENETYIIRPVNALPFIQIDNNTSQPIVYTGISKISGKNLPERATQEQYAKLKKYNEVIDDPEFQKEYGELILDKLVEEKGEDSILAAVYIDGNKMGEHFDGALDRTGNGYEECIKAQREESLNIQENYIDRPRKAIEKLLREKNNKGSKDHRMIVFAGDEMSFICKGRDAFDVVKKYFETLRTNKSENGEISEAKDRSSCAGVALFHSHAPYGEAYKIAKDCCKNAKKKMKENMDEDTCYLDFQYCQGGLGMDLDAMRLNETQELISKPWLMAGESENPEMTTIEEVAKVVRGFRKMNARTNIKGFVSTAKESLPAFEMDLKRAYAHMNTDLQKDSDIKFIFTDDSFNGERRRKLIYDIGIVYDQWFREEK